MSYIGNLPFGKTLRTVTTVTANGSATVFYPDGGYDVNFVDVFVSGARLSSGLDYTASDGISITMLYTPADGDTIDMVAYGLLELVSPVFPVSVTVGSNVVINTTSISVGNSSVNTQIVAGNVTLNGSTLKVGNSSVNTVITGNSVTIGGTLTVTGNVALTTNSVNSSMLTTTGVIANSYGNTTAIPVITVDAAGRITNATTSSVSGVTGLSFAPANSTVTVSTSTTNFDTAITSGNDSVQGLLKVIDSVSNTSTLIAGSANSVTTAYMLAANAVSNATAYAATAYSNAVATAASDATTKAGTAYSNAISYANTAAGTAYSNAVSVASSDATTKAGTAYTNAVATAASDATTKAATAYSNATSYADTKAGTAYTNATAYADTKAATAYSNVFNGGTFSGAVTVQANLTANSVRVNGNMQIDGDLTVSGNTVTINVTNLNVEDNMIYLNSNSTVSHPDLGFAGNYNDGSYKHAGLFRDATDGVWKFFHGYTPEPDASAYIDTANSSFTLSNLQINYVIGNVTGSANSATYLGGNTAATLRSYSDTMAGTAYSNATTYAATIAGTAYSNATSYAATIAGTAYSNATSYAATIAGTAYSNAVAYAASNTYVNTQLALKADLTGASFTGSIGTTSYIDIGTHIYLRGQEYILNTAGNGWNTVIDRNGGDGWIVYGGNSVRAPIFYDSANTTYYVDPASSTTSFYMNGGMITTAPGGTILMRHLVSEVDAWLFMENAANWGLYWKNNPSGNHTFGGYTSIGAELVGMSAANASGNGVATTNYVNATSAIAQWMLSNYTGYMWSASTMFAAGDMRAPIFYDSNDTGYYLNPNGTSNFSSLYVDSYFSLYTGATGGHGYAGRLVSTQSASSNFIPFNIASTRGDHSWGIIARFRIDSSGQDRPSIQFSSGSSDNRWNIGFNTGSDDNFRLTQNMGYRNDNATADGWGTVRLEVNTSGNFYSYVDTRSPIYYDSDDTGYYLNPASGSNLNTVNANRFSAPNNGLLSVGDDSATQTYNDGSTRSRIYVSSAYPAITINGTVGAGNSNHGPTLQFTHNGYDSSRHWVIGTPGTGQNLDFGTGQPANKNPHEGIAGYSGTTCMRMTVAGNVGIGGSWGAFGTVANPSYRMHVQGTGYASDDFRAPIFYDSDNTEFYLNPTAYSQISGAGSTAGSAGAGFGIFSTVAQNSGSIMNFHRAGRYAVNFGLDGDNVMRIGGWSAAANRWQLDMAGNGTYAGNVTAYSDIRLKENVEVISNALQKVQAIRGVTFTRNDQDDKTKRHAGVIAQEVELVLPEVVSEDNTGIKNVAYGNMVSLLIEAIKEQQQQIEELKNLVNKLIGS